MFTSIYRLALIFVLLMALAALMVSPIAHADGGAPNLAYVAGAGKGVSVIDVQQQKATATFDVPGDPHQLLLSLDGRFLYVTQPKLNKVSTVAAKTGQIICSADVPGAPTLLAFDSTLNVSAVFAAGNDDSSVTMLDPTNCNIRGRLQTGGRVYGLATIALGSSVSGQSGNQLWVANDDAITIFDSANGKKIDKIALPDGPRYLSAPPGGTVYAVTKQGSVDSINIAAPHTVSTLISGGSYGPMDFDETNGEIYVPDQKNNQMVVLAPVNPGFKIPKEPLHTISVSSAPHAVAITNDGQLGFFSLEGGNVDMYDIPGNQLIDMIKVGGHPLNIITGLYPPALGTTPQQASLLDRLASIAGYIIVIALLVVPIIFFRRYARVKDADKKDAQKRKPVMPGSGNTEEIMEEEHPSEKSSQE